MHARLCPQLIQSQKALRIRQRERSTFHVFERNLLGEQHITDGKCSFGSEAPLRKWLAGVIELMDVHHGAIGDVSRWRWGDRAAERWTEMSVARLE
jgi:hypothetical protein